MRQTAVCVGIVLLSMNANAMIDVFPICTAAGTQQYPAVCGDIVVWEDPHSGPTAIYAYALSGGKAYAVSPGSGNQRFPRISGGVVVWQDERNAATTGSDIYGYDMSLNVPLTICTAAGLQEYPAIGGRFVVWMDKRNADTGSDIYGYCLDTQEEFAISVAEGAQERPAIDGEWVVWMDRRHGHYQIYGCRLVFPIPAAGLTAIRLFATSTNQGYPVVSGNRVIWHENRGGTSNTDVYGVDLETFEGFTVCEASLRQMSPAISGDLVVWQDERNGATRKDIYGYDLAAGGEFVISAGNSDQSNPAVSGRTVVWQQNGDIWGARLVEPTVLTVTWPEGGQMFLAGSEQEIIWQTDGPPLEQVRISFSSDAGESWQVAEPNLPDTGAYLWKTPDVDSQVCRVRVADFGATGATGTSELFTVFLCDPALTADLTGDCRVDLADFAVLAGQWLMCGNPYAPEWCWE